MLNIGEQYLHLALVEDQVLVLPIVVADAVVATLVVAVEDYCRPR